MRTRKRINAIARTSQAGGGARAIPFTVAGLVAWYDASRETAADGTAMATITDRSGLGHDATQGTGSLQPVLKTNILNGLPVYRGDGTDDYVSAAFALVEPVTVFAVAMQRATGGANQWLHYGNNTNTMGWFANASSVSWRMFAGSIVTIGNGDTTSFHRTCALFNGASSLGRIDDNADVGVNPGANNNPSGVFLFARFPGGIEAGQWDIAEVLVYAASVSSADRNTLMAYLKTKWGL